MTSANICAHFASSCNGQPKGAPPARPPTPPSGPLLRVPDGNPDLAGVWSSDQHFREDLADALKLTKDHMSNADPEANCLPTGVPRMNPYPWSIIQTPTHVYFLFAGNIHSFRQIFMDGRAHTKDPNPTWFGKSIGSWDGDTLVIDTTGFNDKFWFDFAGHPHTEQFHTVERYRRPDLAHLEWDTVVTDPGAYTRPFTVYGHVKVLPKEELMEYICQENNRDVVHILGNDQRNRESRQ